MDSRTRIGSNLANLEPSFSRVCWSGKLTAHEEIQHYIDCPLLWELIHKAAPFVEQSRLARWGLFPPGTARMRRIAAAARLATARHVVHTLRLDHAALLGQRTLLEARSATDHRRFVANFCVSAAHKFQCAIGEQRGAPPPRARRQAS